MSDARFDRIDATLALLLAGQTELRSDVAELKTAHADLRNGVDELTAGQAGLRAGLDDLTAGQADLHAGRDELHAELAGLRTSHDDLRAGQGELRTRQEDSRTELSRLGGQLVQMRNDMGVMHEELLDRIRGASDDSGLRLEMNRRFDEVLAQLRDHALPGDAADRHFARTLNDHEQRLTDLERR